MKHYYTEKQLTELLSHMVILTDTREQSNKTVLEYLDKHKIKYKNKALKTGDYSFMIEACPDLGFVRDTYFTDELVIERKNSVSELAGNFVEKNDRFLKELNRMINVEQVYLLIENDSLSDIFNHNYKSQYNELAYLRTLLTTQRQAGFYLYFVKDKDMGKMIFEICRSILISKILK